MTLLFADGFEDGTTAWTLVNAALGTGRFGNGVVASTGQGSATYNFAKGTGPYICGFAIKTGAAAHTVWSSLWGPYGVLLDRATNGAVSIGGISSGFTSWGSSAAGVLPASAWSYVEVKWYIHDTLGYGVVRVNGVEVLNQQNKDSNFGGADGVNLVKLGYDANGSGGAIGIAYDDFYFADLSGTVNNNFLGELMVEHLRPGSDDTAQWLGSDGNSTNNFDLVDEAGTPVTTDYVASSTVGQRDLYVPVASARPITSPVHGVLVMGHAMKTDVGVRSVKLCAKEGAGGTVRYGTEQGLPTSFGDLSPATFERKGDSSQFTVADVNALRFGVEVAS